MERGLPARAWSFQKHRNCLPLGDPSRNCLPLGDLSASGAIALTQFRLHSKPQNRKQPFFSAGPLKRSTRPENTSEPNRSGLRPTAAGRGRQTPAFSAAGAAARAPRWGSPGPPNLSQVFCSVAPPAQLIPFSGCRLGLQGRGFQGGDGSWCGRLANCYGRFMPLIGKLEMLAKSAAACIPAKSQGGGGGGLAASARAAGAGTRPGEGCAEPR